MNLIKEIWTKSDIKDFQNYLNGLKNQNPQKIEWTRNIINTKMPLLALNAKQMKDIAKQIAKGNFESFLENSVFEYFENTIIYASLIRKLKNFEKERKHILRLSKHIDNWATCDSLNFKNLSKDYEESYFNFAKELVVSSLPFERRIGLGIMFNLIKTEYLNEIFETMNMFYNEEHYYVNMMLAWLLCEVFIVRREQTLEFLKTYKLNKFVINKGVQKCRESFRVSENDKEMLLKFKVK